MEGPIGLFWQGTSRNLDVRPLEAVEYPALAEFLRRDVSTHAIGLGWLATEATSGLSPRADIWVAAERQVLRGVAFRFGVSGVWLSSADMGTDAFGALGAFMSAHMEVPRHVVGPAAAVTAFWAPWGHMGFSARLVLQQRLMSCDRATVSPPSPLRVAGQGDLTDLVDASCQMQLEETGVGVSPFDVDNFRRASLAQIASGRCWVLRDPLDGRLMFRATVAPAAPEVAQIEGVFVPPPFRGSGVATAALGELCRRLLDRHGCVALSVGEGNAAALAVYRKLGFTDLGEYQTLHVA